MKTYKFLIPMFLLGLVFAVAGCAPKGGAEGDANDPASSDDVEQMQSETGSV